MSGLGWSISAIGSVSGSAIFLYESPGRLAHLFGERVIDVNAIDNTDDRGLNRHVLVTDRRSRCFAKGAHHHFAGTSAQSIGYNHDVASWLLVEIVGMNNQEPDALEIGRLFRRPHRAYNFSQEHLWLDLRKHFCRFANIARRGRDYRLRVDINLLAFLNRTAHVVFTDKVYRLRAISRG
jgi:hypothetical protein